MRVSLSQKITAKDLLANVLLCVNCPPPQEKYSEKVSRNDFPRVPDRKCFLALEIYVLTIVVTTDNIQKDDYANSRAGQEHAPRLARRSGIPRTRAHDRPAVPGVGSDYQVRGHL